MREKRWLKTVKQTSQPKPEPGDLSPNPRLLQHKPEMADNLKILIMQSGHWRPIFIQIIQIPESL